MKKILENKRKIKNENGAVSALVLFTVFMFITILGGSYLVVISLQKSQLRSDLRIQELYGKEVNRVDEIYNELTTYAKYDKPYIPTGFTHIEGTWNSGYTVKDSLGNEFVWVPCVTDQSKVKEGDTVETFKKTTEGKYNSDSVTLSTTDTSIIDAEPTEAIRASVGKYGGFYIARYEAGLEGTIENYNLSTKTVTDGSIKPLSKAGRGVWNSISREDALTVASSMVDTADGVKSSLISGECWDTTLQWIVNSSANAVNEPNAGYDTNSDEKGWHSDISSNTRYTTGYFAVNNIYDMAGNVSEWTTENGMSNGTNYLVFRGGNGNVLGSDYPAAHRGSRDDSDYTSGALGFRVVLYK